MLSNLITVFFRRTHHNCRKVCSLKCRPKFFLAIELLTMGSKFSKHIVLESVTEGKDYHLISLQSTAKKSITGKVNLVPRVFLHHTLITKPNEHPGTLGSNLPRKWAIWMQLWISRLARQCQATENARCSSAISARDKSRY